MKHCKGTGKAKGYGCGKEPAFKYGLCKSCYRDWLFNSEDGKQILNKSILRGKKRVEIESNRETRQKKKELKRPNKRADFYNSKAWRYCSKYVLLFYSDSDGKVKCSTSGLEYQLPNKNIQAGHYHKSDAHAGTAFEFKNLAPQSYRDNKYFSGKPEIMKDWLIKTHGEDVIDYLNQLKNKPYKLDDSEFEKWKEHYKKLFNDLVKEKGFNPWQIK